MKTHIDPQIDADIKDFKSMDYRVLYTITDCMMRDTIGDIVFKDPDYDYLVFIHGPIAHIGVWDTESMEPNNLESMRFRRFKGKITLEN